MKISNIMALLALLIGSVIVIMTVHTAFKSPDDIELSSNVKWMKKEIAKHIPIGNDIKSAKRIMQNNGFACHAGKTGEKMSLLCRKTTQFIFKNDWDVYFIYKANLITGYDVVYRTTSDDF